MVSTSITVFCILYFSFILLHNIFIFNTQVKDMSTQTETCLCSVCFKNATTSYCTIGTVTDDIKHQNNMKNDHGYLKVTVTTDRDTYATTGFATCSKYDD
jgi:LAS superfamily LD-carboxypeptidase LdcB